MIVKSIYTIVVISALVLFTGCDSKDSNKSNDTTTQDMVTKKDSMIINIDTSFIVKPTNGNNITIKREENIWNISKQDGKVILLDFFATWCPPCKGEIPHLNNLRSKYKDQFEIIGLLLEEDKTSEEIKSFIDEFNIKYPIANNQDVQKLAKVIDNIKSIPTMFLINTDGKIIQKYVGIVPEEMLASDIKRALKK